MRGILLRHPCLILSPQYSTGHHECYVCADLSGCRPGEDQPGAAGVDDADGGDSLWRHEDGQQTNPPRESSCYEEMEGEGATSIWRLLRFKKKTGPKWVTKCGLY